MVYIPFISHQITKKTNQITINHDKHMNCSSTSRRKKNVHGRLQQVYRLAIIESRGHPGPMVVPPPSDVSWFINRISWLVNLVYMCIYIYIYGWYMDNLWIIYEYGWWLSYPSEKYEFVNWDDDIPNIWKTKNVSNHQPEISMDISTINPSEIVVINIYKPTKR